MTLDLNTDWLKMRLAHVFWMGGSPCAGKSSIADGLVERRSLALYRCDDAFYRHWKIITPEQQPVFHRVMALTSEDMWMRPVPQQVAEEIEIYREEFGMILADLLELPTGQPVLAEGAALLPELVQPLLTKPNQALWVVPTPAFQWHHYSRRPWTKDIVKDCSDPEQAFRNWMDRDVAYAQYVTEQARASGLEVLVVDGSKTIEDNLALVDGFYQGQRE